MKVELTNEQINLIVKALLFSYSVDINADVTSEEEDKFFEIAKNLKEVSGIDADLSGFYILKGYPEEPLKVENLIKIFRMEVR